MSKREPWKQAYAQWVDSTNPNHMEFFSDLGPPYCLGKALFMNDRDHPYWKDCSPCSFRRACNEIFLRLMEFFNGDPPGRQFDFEKNEGAVWRHPGGKYSVRKLLALLFPSMVPVYSGFFGGGNLEIMLALRGHPVWGGEKSFLVANFWQEALRRSREMADYIETNALGYMSPDLFRNLQNQLRHDPPPGFDTACKTWMVNRCCRDGILFAGYSTTRRLRRTAIQRLREFTCPNLTVEQADFRDSLPVNADRYKFLDPPYMSANGSLYLDTNQVDLHKNFPHSELAALLRRHDKWILTYDDVEPVRAMYRGYRKTINLQWKYSAGGKSKPSRELIIVSDDIVVPDTYTWIRD